MASFRQTLTATVPQLKDRTIAARDRLHQLQNLDGDQSDDELLGPLRTDQVFLTNLTAEVMAAINGWQTLVANDTNRAEQEQLMATFPVYWDELDNPADQNDNQWPILKLVGRARTLANTIEGFLAARADQALRSLPNSQSRQNSRAGTPFSQNTYNDARGHESNFFNADPTNNALRGPLDPQLSAHSFPNGFGHPIRQSTPFGVPITTAASFMPPTTTRPTTQPTVTFATTQAGLYPSIGQNSASAFVPVSQTNWANFQLPYSKQPAFSAPSNHNQGFIGQQKPNLRPAPTAPPVPALTTYIKPLRIEPPTFGGNPREWPTFWAAFDSAVHSQPIADFEKHLLLLQYLKKDSPAYKAIEGLPPSDRNYGRAIEMLTDRFGNPGRLEDELHAELLRLPTVQHHSCHALRPFYEKVEQICTQLGQTRPGTDLAGDRVIYHLIKSKLPRETLIKLSDIESRRLDSFSAFGLRLALGQIVAELESVEKYINTFQRSDQRKEQSSHTKRDERHHDRRDFRRVDDIKRQFPDHAAQRRHEDTSTFHVDAPTIPSQQDAQPKHHSGQATPSQQSKKRTIFPCSMCKGCDHRPSECPNYPTAEAKRRRLMEQKRCFVCLHDDHLSKECPHKNRRCGSCHQTGHHQLICPQRDGPSQPPRPPTPINKPPHFTGGNAQPMGVTKPPAFQQTQTLVAMQDEPSVTSPTVPSIDHSTQMPVRRRRKKERAVLMTRTVMAASSEFPDHKVVCNLLLDPGSQNSYITSEMVQRLRPEQAGTDFLRLHVFGTNPPTEVCSPTYMVSLLQVNGEWREFELNVIDHISTAPTAIQHWLHAPHLDCFKQPKNKTAKLDLVIGTREFWSLILSETPIPEDPTLSLVQTIFGPVISGETDSPGHIIDSMAFAAIHTNVEPTPTSNTIEGFWNMEAIGIKENPTQDDDVVAMKLFNDSIQRLENGRYQINWVWREPRQPFGPTWSLAYRRLNSVWRRLAQTPGLLQKYDEYFADQRKQGFLEPTERDDDEFFLPHHPVITPKKLRVVMDASAHTNSTPSLNDALYPGPVILPELPGMLLRWRNCAVPVLADVQSAFMAIEIAPEDRRFCKIMWLKDPQKPPSAENLLYERYKRMVFGVNCSPFLLGAVLLHHFKNYDSPVAKKLAANTYVDNVLLEAENAEEALQMAKEAKAIFADCKMNLREYFTHIPSILDQFPEEDRLGKDIGKVLGLMWDTPNDAIQMGFPTSTEQPPTRRSVLSSLSTVFDPLGLTNPAILPAKLHFQQLWATTHQWDSPLPPKEAAEWATIQQAWLNQTISIPRLVLPASFTDLQLHVFCDASQHTFATAIYLRAETSSGAQSRLIFSKSRLKPLKAAATYTIPRLELLAILAGTRGKAFVEKELRRPISATHYWSDSRIALSWVQSPAPKPQFEQCRLLEIRRHAVATFHFVRTDQNPADFATRGQTPSALRDNAMWWNGPSWLSGHSSEWPDELSFSPSSTESEETCTFVVQHAETVQLGPKPFIEARGFSSLPRLIRHTIWVLRFISLLRPSLAKVSKHGPFTACDYLKARHILIQLDQRHFFAKFTSHPTIINEDGLICIKTRLTYCNGEDGMAHPVLLERHSWLTRLIVLDIHAQLKHAGPDWTLTKFLSSYWMPKAKRTIAHILSSCLNCKRLKTQPFARPEMPPLPAMRVRPARPFEYVGLDLLGPVASRPDGHQSIQPTPIKTWVLIIACLVTRAIYLEPTRDQSAPTFINVLRRFFARRGRPRRIISDNAPTFIQSSKALYILSSEAATTPHLASQGTRWDFIPSFSPWMGATYERLIGLVKNCLLRTIGRRILDYDELSTLLAEIEASVNSRPITWVSDSADGPMPLTPAHFLHNGASTDIDATAAEIDLDDPNLSSPEKLAGLWQAYREASDHFWNRWSSDYLLAIRERAGWTHKDPRLSTHSTPKIGDVVLIQEEPRPKHLWPLGRILSVQGDPPRSVELRLSRDKNGHIRTCTRPVNRICPLETAPIPEQATLEATSAEPRTATHSIRNPYRQQTRQPTPPPPVEVPSTEGKRVRKKKVIFDPSVTMLLIAFACLLIPVASTWPFAPKSDSAELHCTDCLLNCTKRGVTVSAPSHIQKMEVCCLQDCRSRASSTPFTFELPEDVLVIDYKCEAFFWESASRQFHVATTCPAVDSCELFDCWFCMDHLQNPTCNKQWATVLYLALSGISFIILGCLFAIFMSARAAARFLRDLITATLCLPLRLLFWIIGRPWTQYEEQRVAQRVRSTSRRAAHTVRRSVRIARTRLRQMTGSFLVALMLSSISTASGDTISVISHSESCKRGELGIECSITTATTLTLLPAGQTNTLLVRDEHGIVLATLTLRLASLTLDCHPKTEAWLRSYNMESLAVKRCPKAGSCRGDYCSEVRPETSIPELKTVNDIPGNSYCLDSTSFWGNDCALPASACLFYRTFIRPTSSDPFELFSCPGWSTRLIVQLTLEANNGQRQTAKMALHPGLSSKWGNLTLTPLAISLPPMPVLDSKFVTDGRSVAIIDQIPLDLTCPTREDARLLNCTIATSACPECFPNHAEGTVDCSCRHLNLDDLLASPDSRLPLDVAKIHLRNEDSAVFAQHPYSPVQLHIAMHNLSLTMEFRDSKCWLIPQKLVGCYRCSTGAQLDYICHSDHGNPLAKVECADGTLFVAHCAVNGSTNTIILPFDHYSINTECTVDCPAGETHFHLNGTLYFIPLRNRFSTHQHTSGKITTDPEPSQPWFDFSNPWAMLYAHLYFILAILILAFLLIRLLPFILRQTPMFRMARILISICAILPIRHSAASPTSPLCPFYPNVPLAANSSLHSSPFIPICPLAGNSAVHLSLFYSIGLSAVFSTSHFGHFYSIPSFTAFSISFFGQHHPFHQAFPTIFSEHKTALIEFPSFHFPQHFGLPQSTLHIGLFHFGQFKFTSLLFCRQKFGPLIPAYSILPFSHPPYFGPFNFIPFHLWTFCPFLPSPHSSSFHRPPFLINNTIQKEDGLWLTSYLQSTFFPRRRCPAQIYSSPSLQLTYSTFSPPGLLGLGQGGRHPFLSAWPSFTSAAVGQPRLRLPPPIHSIPNIQPIHFLSSTNFQRATNSTNFIPSYFLLFNFAISKMSVSSFGNSDFGQPQPRNNQPSNQRNNQLPNQRNNQPANQRNILQQRNNLAQRNLQPMGNIQVRLAVNRQQPQIVRIPPANNQRAPFRQIPANPPNPLQRVPAVPRHPSLGYAHLDIFLTRVLQPDWFPSHVQLANRILTFHRILSRDGTVIEGEIGRAPASVLLIGPTTTVADFWNGQGTPLRHPNLPCIAQPGGVRGFGRLGRQRLRNGFPVWNFGQRHFNQYPIEHLKVEYHRA